MKNYYDKEFNSIVDDILENTEFKKLLYVAHHGLTRYEHSLRVAYYTYTITKVLHLNYIEATRGALLHDFFTDEVAYENSISRLRKHPTYAVINAKKYFEISLLQKDIIKTHMFPITFIPPKYLESWIVDFCDDVAAIYERIFTTKWKVSSSLNFLLLVIIGILK